MVKPSPAVRRSLRKYTGLKVGRWGRVVVLRGGRRATDNRIVLSAIGRKI
jgi:hypothetical protein